MNWQARYIPPDPQVWQGQDSLTEGCFSHVIQLINLLTIDPASLSLLPAFAFLGFKCDEGSQRDLARTGSIEGPAAIRRQLNRLVLQKANIKIYDVGNIVCMDHDLEMSQQALADVVALLLSKNILPIIIGGGHEAVRGQYQGIAQVCAPQKKIGIINFDPYFELQEFHSRSSTTTAFYQIAQDDRLSNRHFDYNCIGIQHSENSHQSFDTAKQLGCKVILADELLYGLREKCFDFIDRIVDENDIIHFSFSMNVFSPAFAPGVSAIQPLGLSPWQIIPLIRQAAACSKVVTYSITEHVPRYDIDHCTAKLAALMIYEILHHHAEHSNFSF